MNDDMTFVSSVQKLNVHRRWEFSFLSLIPFLKIMHECAECLHIVHGQSIVHWDSDATDRSVPFQGNHSQNKSFVDEALLEFFDSVARSDPECCVHPASTVRLDWCPEIEEKHFSWNNGRSDWMSCLSPPPPSESEGKEKKKSTLRQRKGQPSHDREGGDQLRGVSPKGWRGVPTTRAWQGRPDFVALGLKRKKIKCAPVESAGILYGVVKQLRFQLAVNFHFFGTAFVF